MNDAMYEHPATHANLDTLRARGVDVLEPGHRRARARKGEWGVGRLPEPPELLAAVEAVGAPAARRARWTALRVLVTAGGTREPIDAVRFVGNRSSGRMGFALADEAARRGAAVTVVAANVALPRNPGIEYVDVGTAAELAEAACERASSDCDVLLMAAAVADYRPAERGRRQDQEGRRADGSTCASSAPRTSWPALSAAPPARPAARRLRGRARRRTPSRYGRDKLERKGLDASWSTTSRAPTSASTPPTTR